MTATILLAIVRIAAAIGFLLLAFALAVWVESTTGREHE